jgi:NTE family protein
VGLALSGGGALAAWQAGVLAEFKRAGLAFDEVLGFSAGALAGAAVVLDNVGEVVRRWREVDDAGLLTFAPRRSPLSLFSGEPVWNSIRDTWDDSDAKRRARGALTVIGLDAKTRMPEYSRFDAAGGVWEGPLARRLLASCAIPVVFPPVEVGGRVFVDGGVRGAAPMSFLALSRCRDVVVVEMVRPDERGMGAWSPQWLWERVSRERTSVNWASPAGFMITSEAPSAIASRVSSSPACAERITTGT